MCIAYVQTWLISLCFFCHDPLLIHVSYFRSSHGTRQMSKEEITDCYGEKHIWTDFNSLEENPIQHCMSDIISHG